MQNRKGLLASLIYLALLVPHGIMNAQEKQEDAASAKSSTKTRKVKSLDELLLFFPTKFPQGDWAPADLHFEDILFEATDRTKLHAWYCPADKPRGFVLIAHGNAGNIAFRAEWIKYLQNNLKLSVFMFDYRGYGRSQGTPTVPGILLDAEAAHEKFKAVANIKDSDILLMGESLGGAVAVHLASKKGARGLIIQSSFSSMRDVAKFHYPQLAWVVPKNKLNSVASISKYQGPLLLSHGTADETIPFDSGKELLAAANNPKKFFAIENGSHNDWLSLEYLAELDRFINETAPSKTKNQ